MKKYIVFYIGFLLLLGCQEPYYPNIDETRNFLTVDAIFSTNPYKSRVIVTMSDNFSKHMSYNPVNGLTIYVLDTTNSRIDFVENGNSGIYQTGNNEASSAKIGNVYTLYIETPEGDIYKSTPQKVAECPAIQKLTVKVDKEATLTEDGNGDVVEFDYEGVAFYVDTKAILPEKNYYLYKWYGYEEHRTTIGRTGQQSTEIYRHVPISSMYTNIVCTGNADDTYNKYIKENKFVFIPEFTYKNYVPPVPSDYNIYDDQFNGYLFASEQYSISEDAYTFWKGAEDQLEASGKLFGPVSSQIVSNISCVNNPDNLIYGVFYTPDIKLRYDYVFVNSKNRLFTRQLDSLPQLWIDTCSWGVPEGWIFPPF